MGWERGRATRGWLGGKQPCQRSRKKDVYVSWPMCWKSRAAVGYLSIQESVRFQRNISAKQFLSDAVQRLWARTLAIIHGRRVGKGGGEGVDSARPSSAPETEMRHKQRRSFFASLCHGRRLNWGTNWAFVGHQGFFSPKKNCPGKERKTTRKIHLYEWVVRRDLMRVSFVPWPHHSLFFFFVVP